MDPCSDCRPLLVRVAEGEADPDEALQVARHVPGCTPCRILLAREIRLARMLDTLDDAIPVDEAFLAEVMRALPSDPPRPLRPRSAARRGLKLAAWLGGVAIGAGIAARLTQLAGSTELSTPLAHLRVGDMDGMLATAASAARLALELVDRVSSGFAVSLPALDLGSPLRIAALLPGALAVAALSVLVAVFARCEPRG